MRHAMSGHRPLLVLTLAAATVLVPSAAEGQLAMQPANVSLLVLPPVPAITGDSTFAVEVGDAVRKRIDAKLRLKLRVTTKDKMAEALSNSGFAPDAILDENAAQQLARFMNVDAYMTGRLERNSTTPILKLRLVEGRRSGLGGWVTVKGVAGKDLADFASLVADSVDVQVKAAEQTRECLDRRDRKDYGSAEERAARAFRIAPNHPGAALCLAAILELKKAPLDSQVAVYRRAAAGDPLLNRVWDGLARLYQQKGDTAGWAEALIKNLESNPTDMRMRFAAVELLYLTKQYVRSVDLLDEGLQRSPGDNLALQLKARSCYDGQLWGCAVTALGERYDADSAVQTDSLYLLKIMVAAQAVNDSAAVSAAPAHARSYFRTAPDNAAMEKWTGIAVQKFPNSASFWKHRAAALKTNGKVEESLAALRRAAQLDPLDFPSRIQIALVLSERAGALVDSLKTVQDGLKADTARLRVVRATWDPIVTARFAPADTILDEATRLATEDTKVNVAILYLQPATKLVQNQIRPDLAIQWLEKAIALDPKKQIATQANFFMGLAYVYNMGSLDIPNVQKNKDCQGLANIVNFVAKAKSAMTAGASVQQGTADQVIKSLAPYENFVSQARAAWKCK